MYKAKIRKLAEDVKDLEEIVKTTTDKYEKKNFQILTDLRKKRLAEYRKKQAYFENL